LWNIACGLLLLRLWYCASLPSPFIAGFYLVSAGLGRFVEESFRGEPQTPTVARLPVYQWNAVLSLVAGAVITCIPSPDRTPASLTAVVVQVLDPRVVVAALAFGFITFVAMGVDFPGSNRRFSRLV
jgi:prolipoprotein diacylglyceryltransferase